MGSNRGFTLLELILICGVISVASAIAIPAVGNVLARNRVITSANLLAAQIREARLSAITRNQRFRVRFDCPVEGAYRMLAVTGVAATDNAADRCTTSQPNDGPPMYMASEVDFDGAPPDTLEINGRGQISLVGGGMPAVLTFDLTHGDFNRTIGVSASGRVTVTD